MSKNINVNPGNYKVAGRERQGEDIVHEIEKQKAAKIRLQRRKPMAAKLPSALRSRLRKSARPVAKADRRPLRRVGISNRLSAEAETRTRAEHPRIVEAPPPPEDAGGRAGDELMDEPANAQSSRKVGTRSNAQKQAGVRQTERSTPASNKVAGAFGREPRKGRA